MFGSLPLRNFDCGLVGFVKSLKLEILGVFSLSINYYSLFDLDNRSCFDSSVLLFVFLLHIFFQCINIFCCNLIESMTKKFLMSRPPQWCLVLWAA